LQGGSGSTEDQPHAAKHLSSLGEGPSGHEMEFTEDPFGHKTEFTKDPPEVPPRRTRKSHYVTPPSVPTNPESRPIIKQSLRGNHFLYSQSIIIIHANTNCCTYLSCLQLRGGHHILGHMPSKEGQCYLR
jgi:hypothetical protein